MKISALIYEAHAIACDKGWHERPACGVKARTDRDGVGVATFVPPVGVDVTLVGSWLALIHTELGEAWDDYEEGQRGLYRDKAGKPCGMLSELADVIIRVADLSGALGLQLSVRDHDEDATLADLHDSIWWQPPERQTPQQLMLDARRYVDYAVEELRKLAWEDLCESLASLIGYCEEFARLYCTGSGDDSVTLEHAIRVKMDYNRTRPYRHGGKAL